MDEITKLQQSHQNLVKRIDEAGLILGTPDTIYNEPMFDICSDDKLFSLVNLKAYSPALDAIGFQNSTVEKVEENVITYIRAANMSELGGYEPSSGILQDPCEPGESVESSHCTFRLDGWTRVRRSGPVRDLTNEGVKYCVTQPMYTIAGQLINSDSAWDLLRLNTVALQDMQRMLMIGDRTEPNQTDGFLNLIDNEYVDPASDEECHFLAGHVVDWGGNGLDLVDVEEADLEDIYYNGNVITVNHIVRIINTFVRMLRARLRRSTISGVPKIIALMPLRLLGCFIEAYACFRYCQVGPGGTGDYEKRQELERIHGQFARDGYITLPFEGMPITFFDYDYGLEDPLEAGLNSFVILTPDVGSNPIVRIQVKDMQNSLNRMEAIGKNVKYRVTDNNRWLSWSTFDNTCFQNHLEVQFRVYMRAPWMQMKVLNVACSAQGLDDFSMDELSNDFLRVPPTLPDPDPTPVD